MTNREKRAGKTARPPDPPASGTAWIAILTDKKTGQERSLRDDEGYLLGFRNLPALSVWISANYSRVAGCDAEAFEVARDDPTNVISGPRPLRFHFIQTPSGMLDDLAL